MKQLRFPVAAVTVGLLAAISLVGRPGVLAQGGAPVLSAQVLGPNVTFTWTGVDGATNYVLRAGSAPGQYQVGLPVGNTTTFSIAAPAVGTYYVAVEAVVAGIPIRSSEITVQILSMFVPPTAPTDLTAYINGTSALITWAQGTGGGAPTSQILYAGTTPGGSEVGAFPVAGTITQLAVPNVAPNTYYLRMKALNAGGESPASNEAVLEMPVGGGCSAPPARTFAPAAFGTYAQFSWTGVPFSAGYRLEFGVQGQGITLAQPLAANITRWSVPRAPLGNFYGRLVTSFSCGSQTTGADVPFTIDGAPPPGPRTPNPPAGQRLPLPNMSSVINQLARERPDLLRASCPTEHPGETNRFMFEAVRRLRAIDNRWGLNWKRGNRGDLSQDIVNYNYGSQPDEDTTEVYIIDIIGGHCGPNPTPNWGDQTEVTAERGAIGRWTLLPYLDAGFPIVSSQAPQ